MDITENLLDKLRPIRLMVLDVDGVLTDGSLFFHANGGQESKAFNTQDGQGIKLLQASGVKMAIITGRVSKVVSLRAEALSIEHTLLGREDKITALSEIVNELNLDWSQVGYCGDDLPDLAAIRKAGFGASVANAPSYIQQYSDYTTQREGGKGAVREITDLIMQAQGTWQACIDHYLYNLRAH
ncbi:KdsC family phosphatase [Marinospirillum insulare]|uniref:3-deoxy-D-manno-octulosonate 8-phosphate phosphatase KdsC n=1 Tax=Marinospirillum insulare TaxID=217169 RepID=A0ABQ5ZVW6_9GAMM|nr:HAD hydrolase family protein [Marinospirillum insulare]GLR63178.1 3-deoxy-D-manno-octulosonate 8-phosphate phosphatase [Marinospirillum insulare]